MATKHKTIRTATKKASRGKPRKGWKAVFLARLAETGNATEAARAAGVARSTAYLHRADDPDFMVEWDDSTEAATDEAEAELFRRAVRGVDRPVFANGKKVGTFREYSDTLLIFYLKGRRPEVYGNRAKHELSGPNGGPLPVSIESAIDDIYGGDPADSEPVESGEGVRW